MAWKEFSDLKQEDQQYELAKQKMIVKQSSLKVAADLVLAADKEKNDIATLSSATRTIADVLTNWVYEEINTEQAKPSIALPTPTAKQQKVLEKIAGELNKDVDSIKSGVLDFAEKEYNVRKYPENVDSVKVFVDNLK